LGANLIASVRFQFAEILAENKKPDGNHLESGSSGCQGYCLPSLPRWRTSSPFTRNITCSARLVQWSARRSRSLATAWGPGCPTAAAGVGQTSEASFAGGCAELCKVPRGDGGHCVHNGPVGMPENPGAPEASGRLRPRSSQREWRRSGRWMSGGTTREKGREETAHRAALRAACRRRAKKNFEPAFHPQAPA